MTLSPGEAAEALSAIEAAESRSRAAYGYFVGGSHLILWGVIWVVCYGLVDVQPAAARLIWLVGGGFGILGSVLLRRSRHRRERGAWRGGVMAAGYVVFAFIALGILQPHRVETVSAFVALVVALAYVQIGMHSGDRISLIGVAVAALTLAGYLWIPVHFHLYMAIVGGGSLILAGCWLRRV